MSILLVTKECRHCKNKFDIKKSDANRGRGKYCSKQCTNESYKGSGNPFYGKKHTQELRAHFSKIRFKGGVSIDNGYYRETGNSGKLIHRKIVEESIGRKLMPHEIVHHINENTLDNRIENLQIVTRAQHMKIHKEKWTTFNCAYCKKEFKDKPHKKRIYCSKSCAGKIHGCETLTRYRLKRG